MQNTPKPINHNEDKPMSEFTHYDLENTTGEAKDILETINQAYGFIPNLFSYMAEAPVTIKAYMQLNQLLDETSIPASQLQVALLAVSKEHDCDFCTVAHSAIGKGKGAKQQSLDAVVNGETIADPQDKALVDVVLSMVRNRGWVSEEERQAFYAAGFSKAQYLEAVLIVTIKTLSNYTNHVTLPAANPELTAMLD